jgi:hypothetical protein
MEMMKSRKGILLTLVTVILVVLMLAELVTYVYTNINYETVDSFNNVANGGYRFAATLNSSTSSFLHTSLTDAVLALAKYEASGKRTNTPYINNTAYALQSLMMNGSIYGTNEITLMGGATLNNYTRAVVLQARNQNLKAAVSNASLQVYQTSPYSINATYTALVSVNSSSGIITYPLSASSGFLINGSQDLYSIQDGNNYTINIASGYPSAVLVGNVYAVSGSRGPFQFVYGTIIVTNSLTSCGGLPSRFENINFILAVPNDPAGSCGFGGVITYNNLPGPGAYTVPYLVYSSSSNIINKLNNGTSLLLDGKGLSLLDISQIKNAMNNGTYFRSTFAPSYLDWGQQNMSKRSQSGIFSFNLYNKQVAYLNGLPDYISAPIGSYFGTNNQLTASAWIYLTPNTNGPIFGVSSLAACGGGWNMPFLSTNGLTTYGWIYGDAAVLTYTVPSNGWYNLAITYNPSGSGLATFYVDGAQVGSETGEYSPSTVADYWTTCISGLPAGVNSHLTGQIAEVQAYSAALTHQQIYQLYLNGIDGLPAPSNSLVGWWPLNGNPNDYSGNGNNGITNSVAYGYLHGYSGNPVYDGSYYGGNLTNIMEGVSNCASISQCNNFAVQQLYLGSGNLSSKQGASLTAAATFGLANALVPNVAYFSGTSGYVEVANQLPVSTISMSAWVYLPSYANCAGPNCIIINKENEYEIAINSGGVFDSAIQPNWVWEPSTSNVPLNKWTFVAATWDGTTENLYVNGVLSGSVAPPNTGGIAQDTNCIRIGARGCPSAAVAFFNGSIADVQIYSTALSGTQISQLYQNDTVMGVNAIDRWPLSGGYNGIMNQTLDTANAMNFGNLKNVNIPCSTANAINNQCGVYFTQP